MGITAYPGRLIGGSLEFNGHEIEKMSEKELRKVRGNEISIIFQDPMTSLNPVYSIGNQIREVVMLHTDKNKQQANERAKELLTLVGINEPETVSYTHLDVYKRQLLGKLEKGSVLTLEKLDSSQHFTQPPAHFTEASLVKSMEEQGIGRPSTYARCV